MELLVTVVTEVVDVLEEDDCEEPEEVEWEEDDELLVWLELELVELVVVVLPPWAKRK